MRVFICSGEILKQGNLSALRWTEGSNDGGISVLAKQWTTIKNYWGIWKEHLMALFNLWLPSQPQLICRQIPHSFPEEKILASGHVSLITLNLEGVSKTLCGDELVRGFGELTLQTTKLEWKSHWPLCLIFLCGVKIKTLPERHAYVYSVAYFPFLILLVTLWY